MKVITALVLVGAVCAGLVGGGVELSRHKATAACDTGMSNRLTVVQSSRAPDELHGVASDIRGDARLIWTDSVLRGAMQRVAKDVDDTAALMDSTRQGGGLEAMMAGMATLRPAIVQDTQALWAACDNYS